MSAVAGLDPDLDEARRLLVEELQETRYGEPFDPIGWLVAQVERFQLWLAGLGQGDAVVGAVAAVLLVLLLGAVLYLVSRSSRRSHAVGADAAVVGIDPGTSAEEYLARARRALEGGHASEAVADAVRSLAVNARVRTLLSDLPSLTVHEVTEQLARPFPDHREALRTVGVDFDAAVYGRTPLPIENAQRAIALTERLRDARPVLEPAA